MLLLSILYISFAILTLFVFAMGVYIMKIKASIMFLLSIIIFVISSFSITLLILNLDDKPSENASEISIGKIKSWNSALD